eukprot:TRINITY_DN29671_c0_g1_i1.p1 TRINITY_DN29671_c0_g1~~TRINITY_DN29671_c0_g1_i1.p1  ORF type:complete len:502 (+),score=82.46 TRINITY_DN29671_c0_g1_i1:152-1507(+)
MSHGEESPPGPTNGYPGGSVSGNSKQPSTSTPSAAPEQRIDPEDGEPRTFSQMRRLYGGYYPESELEKYWQACQPVETSTQEPTGSSAPVPPAEVLTRTDQDGWWEATLSSAVPLPEDEDPQRSAARLLLGGRALGNALESVQRAVPGLECHVDFTTLRADLILREKALLNAQACNKDNKEELKLEKKLREVSTLRDRQCSGQVLEKLQVEKLAKRTELFAQVAELKLTRGWSELGSALARHLPRFQDSSRDDSHFSHPLYSEAPTASSHAMPATFKAAGGVAQQPHPAARKPKQQAAERRILDPEFVECGICFENVLQKGQRFGILETCDHAFCLSCIRSWRREREQQDRQNLRLCPVCRKESFFVVPSDKILFDPDEKKQIIDEYKNEMGRIPCKLFDYGRGHCPFGTSCFYAHLNPDGTRHVPAPLRWMAGAEGHEVKGEVRLSDFFD